MNYYHLMILTNGSPSYMQLVDETKAKKKLNCRLFLLLLSDHGLHHGVISKMVIRSERKRDVTTPFR